MNPFKNPPSFLCPLFWQHGEPAPRLRKEIRKMKEGGAGSFIVEARPHPEYLEAGWWRDLDIILDEAQKQHMQVWIFDDGEYPSGSAFGRIARDTPQFKKKYLAENHIDVTGPKQHCHFLVDSWLLEGETLFKIIAGKRVNRGDALEPGSLIDITPYYRHQRVYWQVPDGDWRIFIVKISPYGDESRTADYLNPLDSDAVARFIEIVYERHYQQYSRYFGNVIAGFFMDEPRFGNTTGYDCILGSKPMPLPYCGDLLEQLSRSPLGDFSKLLPCLWYDCGNLSKDARYVYMDTVSRLFADRFIWQIGNWCDKHNVKLIGHFIEENGAHTRIGYGTGHYFRSSEALHAAGLDIVNNLFPEQTSGSYTTYFNCFDCDFNHWGLSKMASSAAHLDPRKNGTTLCEAFGAYGWFEGLKLMKWITDAVTVRGINFIVPHAFSPANFPDGDCPPHFYAGGKNPQWPYFHLWADYANRICRLLSQGRHVANLAVLYHAEAEWGGGKCEPFEKAVKLLAQNHMDCDVVWADLLLSESCALTGGKLVIAEEAFSALIVPYAEILPAPLLNRLESFAEKGFPVVFLRALPSRSYFDYSYTLDHVVVKNDETLVPYLKSLKLWDIETDCPPDLCYYHYQNGSKDLYFFTNQSARQKIKTWIAFRDSRSAVLYDPMSDKTFQAIQGRRGDCSKVWVDLEPCQSIFVLFGAKARSKEPRLDKESYKAYLPLDGKWTVRLADAASYPHFQDTTIDRLVDLSLPEYYPDFSGVVQYQISFDGVDASSYLLDLGEVYELATVALNGEKIAELICPPYQVEIPGAKIPPGKNELRIEVVNTVVKSQTVHLFDKYFPQEPTGLLGDVKLWYKTKQSRREEQHEP